MHRPPRGTRTSQTPLGKPSSLVPTVIVGLLIATQGALAGDWPQILGPNRNGLANDELLADSWPAKGPRTIWQRDVGQGFSGLAVRKDTAVLLHRVGNDLVGEGLDPATGKARWKVSFPTRYRSTISPDSGPRCVPLVSGDRVFLLGPAGELQCVELATGKKLWYRNLLEDFGAREGYFGAGSTPIVESGKLLINVGGRGAGLVALSTTDGKTLWKSTDEGASYSSPTAATLDGVRHVVFVTRLNVVSVDPQTGDVRFRFPFGARGPTVNAANPLILGDHLFVTASYGVGSRWAKIGPREATTQWESDDVMSSQYSTSVENDGYLYGIDGRQDLGVARLRCFDPTSGKVTWTAEGFGTGTMILADGKLLILKTDGKLILADPSPKKYRPLAATQLFDTTVQALPALSNGRFFARDTKTLKCVAVGRAP